MEAPPADLEVPGEGTFELPAPQGFSGWELTLRVHVPGNGLRGILVLLVVV